MEVDISFILFIIQILVYRTEDRNHYLGGSEYIKRHSKAKHKYRTPAYSRALRRIKGVFQRVGLVWDKLSSDFQRVRRDRVAVKVGVVEKYYSSYSAEFILCTSGKLADSNGNRRKTTHSSASSKTRAFGKIQQD